MIINQGQIFFWVLFFAAGFFIGGLIFWAAGRNRTKGPTADQPQDPWLLIRRMYLERTSLWQERSSGKLAVRIGDQMVLNSNELSEAQRKTINAALKDWLVWLGFQAGESSSPSKTVDVQPAEPAKTVPPASKIPTVITTTQDLSKSTPEKPKSIVEQIDEILQEKLRTTAIANKGVRLAEDPKEGVVVWVGLEHYHGVDSVTDPEVKAVLKAAVSEWERHQIPGKS